MKLVNICKGIEIKRACWAPDGDCVYILGGYLVSRIHDIWRI